MFIIDYSISIAEEKKKGDWYEVKKHNRHFALKIVFIIEDMLENNILISSVVFKKRLRLMTQAFNMKGFEDVLNSDWLILRRVIRNMQRRYSSEENHDSFQSFYDESVKLWMQLQKDIEC